MKKLINLFFAVGMMFSIVFIGEAISSNGNLSVRGQQSTTVKQRKKGIIRKSYAGGRYVVRKTWNGTKWVSRKVWIGTYAGGRYVVRRTWTGTKWVSRKVWVGTKWAAKKSW